MESLESIIARQLPSDIAAAVDHQLSIRFKDNLALADFALLRSGAFPVAILTSKSAILRYPPRRSSAALGNKQTASKMIPNSIESALDADLQPGSCWMMGAPTGHLGVALPLPVFITNITIDHIPWELVPSIGDAPRSVVVWGLLENAHLVANYGALLRSDLQPPKAAMEAAVSLNSRSTFVELARLEYNISQDKSHVQSVPVHSAVLAAKRPFEIVLLEVKSNWGRDHTCLYRFRVHGQVAAGH
jgi:hypothetical protein